MIKTGVLVTAVGAILVMGWVRQTEAPAPESTVRATHTTDASDALPESPAAPLGNDAPPHSDARRGPDSLAERAARDSDRLARSAGLWTLQLLVACRPETISRLREKAGSTDRLFLLPVELDGRPCYRACWGVYGSRDEAAAARDLPPALRPGAESARPRAVKEVTP